MSSRDGVGLNYRVGIGILSCVIVVLLFAGTAALAQVSTGIIQGVVRDASGASVPQADVTLVNTDTNQTRTAKTEDDGSYRFPALTPGHYSVKVEKQGFGTETNTGLTLEVTQTMAVNFTLQVGTTQQEVVITGEAPLVNTTGTELGGIVNEQQMTDLPLNGRNYIDLATMQSGVTVNANVVGSTAQGGTEGVYYSASGASLRSNAYTIDGATMVNVRGGNPGGEGGQTLGVDGIKEFRVVTGNFDASYGIVSGSHVVLVSKGGTNQFHGDVFEYLRNSSLDARNYFDFPAGSPGHRLPEFQRNNFGGAFGGPIRKDKTFFYAVYEGLRQRLGQTVNDVLPPASCRGGGVVGTIIMPGSGAGQCPFITSATALSAVANGLFTLLPLPSCTTLNCTAYSFPAPSAAAADYGQIRVDHNFSASDSMFGRLTTDRANGSSYGSGVNTGNTTGFPSYLFVVSSRDYFATLSENHIFSPTLLNTVRISYSRNHLIEDNFYPGGAASLTGPGLSYVAGQPNAGVSPASGFTGFAPNGNNPQFGIVNTYSIDDDIYYTKGKHAFKFGTLLDKYNTGLAQNNNGRGGVSFASLTTFLEGLPSGWSGQGVPNPINDKNFMYYSFGFYAQDDWRVLPRLTVNLGLRYEAMTVPSDTNGRNNALVHPFTDTEMTPGPIFTNPSKLDFQPRLGFAWDVFGTGKLAVRAGIGLYSDVANITSALFVASKGNYPYDALATHTNCTTYVAPPGTPSACQLIDPAVKPLAQQLPFTALEAHTQYGLEYYQKQPRTAKASLTVESQLPGNMALAVSYVGTFGWHLMHVQEDNPQIPVAFGAYGYPIFAPQPTTTQPCTSVRINPCWPSLLAEASDGHSSYHALQMTLNKRLGHGLAIQSSYTYSHLIDNGVTQFTTSDCTSSGMVIPGDADYVPSWNRGPACYDITHVLNFNVIYHIPNIKSDNFAAKLEHGWWTGGILSIDSGAPFTPIISAARNQTVNSNGQGVNRASVNTAALITSVDCSVPKACAYTPIPYDPNSVITFNPNQWFNPNMFSISPQIQPCPGQLATVICGTLGDASRGMLRGPGLGNLNFSLNKDTHLPFLGEQGMLEFRTEVFNILNRANFGQPNGTIFNGTVTDIGSFSEAPTSTAGKITGTNTRSRQIQFALRVNF